MFFVNRLYYEIIDYKCHFTDQTVFNLNVYYSVKWM